MNYFEPQFWLGMTASPERTDNYDVYWCNVLFSLKEKLGIGDILESVSNN